METIEAAPSPFAAAHAMITCTGVIHCMGLIDSECTKAREQAANEGGRLRAYWGGGQGIPVAQRGPFQAQTAWL